MTKAIAFTSTLPQKHTVKHQTKHVSSLHSNRQTNTAPTCAKHTLSLRSQGRLTVHHRSSSIAVRIHPQRLARALLHTRDHSLREGSVSVISTDYSKGDHGQETGYQLYEVCGGGKVNKMKKKKGHSTLSGEAQKHYTVPKLELIKKHAMETYWVMENIGPRIHNQGKWQPAWGPDRCTTRERRRYQWTVHWLGPDLTTKQISSPIRNRTPILMSSIPQPSYYYDGLYKIQRVRLKQNCNLTNRTNVR